MSAILLNTRVKLALIMLNVNDRMSIGALVDEGPDELGHIKKNKENSKTKPAQRGSVLLQCLQHQNDTDLHQ